MGDFSDEILIGDRAVSAHTQARRPSDRAMSDRDRQYSPATEQFCVSESDSEPTFLDALLQQLEEMRAAEVCGVSMPQCEIDVSTQQQRGLGAEALVSSLPDLQPQMSAASSSTEPLRQPHVVTASAVTATCCPPVAASCSGRAVGVRGGRVPRRVAPLSAGGSFHKWLLDMLPLPIVVRTAEGDIIYSNRAACTAVGLLGGGMQLLERWQFTPRAVPRPGVNANVEGELDLPRGPMASATALPVPTEGHPVLLQANRVGGQTAVVMMHRRPFWILDASGAHFAVVLYVGASG